MQSEEWQNPTEGQNQIGKTVPTLNNLYEVDAFASHYLFTKVNQ